MIKHGIRTAACLMTIFLCAALSQAKTITLRYAQQNPDTGWSTIHCVDPWLKQLEEATGGQVDIQAFHGETLAKGKDLWNAVKSGIADIGWICHGYFPGLTPLTDVVSLPALPFRTAEKGSEVLWKLYEQTPEIQKEFKDVKVLLFYTSEPYNLITRDRPVKSMEDLKGLKIRMTGGPPTDMAKALGAVPLLVPMTDIYISLQKGVIDGMGTPWEAINTYRFYEVVKYYTEVPFPAVYFSIVMNKNTWNRLSEEIQSAIMRVGGLEGSRFWGRNFFDAIKADTLEKIKASGNSDPLYQLSREENDRWLEIGGKPVWSEWVRRMESRGISNASDILDRTIRLSEK